MSFLLLFYKKIQTKHFFVAFTCRKAKDGNDNMGCGERWPVIARAVLEKPDVVQVEEGGGRRRGPGGVGGRWRVSFLPIFCL